MGFIQTIELHRNLYTKSVDVEQMKKAENELLAIYNAPSAYEETKNSAFELVILLKTKRRLLNYFSSFTDESYQYLYEGSKTLLNSENIYKSEEASKLLSSSIDLAAKVKLIVEIIIETKWRVVDNDNKRITSDISQCSGVFTICDNLAEQINALVFEGFPENVVFIDYKKCLLDEIEALRTLAKNCISEIENEEVNKLKEKIVVEFKTDYPFNDVYRPLPDFSNISNLVIINSPIIEEVNLFIESYKRHFNKEILVINANFLEKETIENIDKIFEIIKRTSADLFVTNLYKYSGVNKSSVFKHLYNYAETGRRVFIYNTLIDDNIYEYYISLAANDGSIRASKIGNYFVVLPSFDEVVSFLQKNGLHITDEILNNIKKEFPFVGYEGLNLCLYDHRQGRNWYVRARKVSDRNQSENPIEKYISKISTQSQFISTDWGNFKENINLNKTKSYDYDLINEINDKFVEEIMYSDLNIIEKCGVLIRYILTGGNDYKILEDMPKEELEDRVTKATYLTTNLLGIEFKPEVEFSDVIDKQPNISGICRNGGRIIEYKNESCRNGAILTTLPHECYHAFQFMTATGYRNWFWEELYVSEARTKYWAENFNTYSDIKDKFYVYYNQVVEADARTFADDCVAAADRLWHKFNFKK